MILGGVGVTLENLVGAYTALARQSIAGTPRYLASEPLQERRMMSAGAAFIIRDLLESGGPSARAAADSTDARRGIAWKTGTSFGFRDACAVGVDQRYTVGVWVGRPDGTPNPGFFGANVAAPLLVDIFAALPGGPHEAFAGNPRQPPPGVSQRRICWPLGGPFQEAAAHLCHQQRTAWVLGETVPPTLADRVRDGSPVRRHSVDSSNGRRADADCARGSLVEVETARWPAALEPWLDAATRQKAMPPAWSAACGERHSAEAGLAIVGVGDGEVLRRAGAGQDRPGAANPTIRLDVRGHRGEINWLIDGRLVGRARAGEGLVYRFPKPGRHTITALDDQGRYDRVTVSVQD